MNLQVVSHPTFVQNVGQIMVKDVYKNKNKNCCASSSLEQVHFAWDTRATTVSVFQCILKPCHDSWLFMFLLTQVSTAKQRSPWDTYWLNWRPKALPEWDLPRTSLLGFGQASGYIWLSIWLSIWLPSLGSIWHHLAMVARDNHNLNELEIWATTPAGLLYSGKVSSTNQRQRVLHTALSTVSIAHGLQASLFAVTISIHAVAEANGQRVGDGQTKMRKSTKRLVIPIAQRVRSLYSTGAVLRSFNWLLVPQASLDIRHLETI